jgi:hypothetical protein
LRELEAVGEAGVECKSWSRMRKLEAIADTSKSENRYKTYFGRLLSVFLDFFRGFFPLEKGKIHIYLLENDDISVKKQAQKRVIHLKIP